MYGKCFPALLIFLITIPLFSQPDQNKVALVIGNGDYRELGNLPNPPNDASDMASELINMGFIVDLIIDGNLQQMENAVVVMSEKLSSRNKTIGFFFFAGHGIQSRGINYLIPAGASIPAEDFLPERALSAQVVLNIMKRAKNDLNVVILDACRNNPFSWNRSTVRGLSVLSSQPPGSIIVYATSAGDVALDGTGRNGVFTSELLKYLGKPGLDIKEVFNLTGKGVMEASRGSQIPAIYSQFFDTAYLAGITEESSNKESETITSQPPEKMNRDITYTQTQVLINGGIFRMGSTSGDEDESPVHPVTLNDYYIMPREVTFREYDDFALETGRSLPEDNNWGRDDRPVINISWYDAIAYANWLSDQDGLTPAYTIDGSAVSWNRHADGWRLPTEAEWEFAAKGGTYGKQTLYSGSSDADAVAWYKENSGERTHQVGSRESNELNLFDMSGNAWEWCWDWYDSDFFENTNQENPEGPDEGIYKVIRGGSWSYSFYSLRVTNRNWGYPDSRSGYGFRLVKSVTD